MEFGEAVVSSVLKYKDEVVEDGFSRSKMSNLTRKRGWDKVQSEVQELYGESKPVDQIRTHWRNKKKKIREMMHKNKKYTQAIEEELDDAIEVFIADASWKLTPMETRLAYFLGEKTSCKGHEKTISVEVEVESKEGLKEVIDAQIEGAKATNSTSDQNSRWTQSEEGMTSEFSQFEEAMDKVNDLEKQTRQVTVSSDEEVLTGRRKRKCSCDNNTMLKKQMKVLELQSEAHRATITAMQTTTAMANSVIQLIHQLGNIGNH